MSLWIADSRVCPIASLPPIKISIASSVIAVVVRDLSDCAIASIKHVAGAFVVRASLTRAEITDEHRY